MLRLQVQAVWMTLRVESFLILHENYSAYCLTLIYWFESKQQHLLLLCTNDILKIYRMMFIEIFCLI